MIQWAWSYFTYQRGARLITGDTTLPGWTGTHAFTGPSDADNHGDRADKAKAEKLRA